LVTGGDWRETSMKDRFKRGREGCSPMVDAPPWGEEGPGRVNGKTEEKKPENTNAGGKKGVKCKRL